nr:ATP-binding cassette domain-containing protein [Aquimixticola soesokkakensis]
MFTRRLVQRAELLASFAAVLGVTAMVSDLTECLAQSGDDSTPPEALAGALEFIGLQTEVSVVEALTARIWPAIAQMTSGQLVLVLAQDGDVLTIFDRTCPDNRAEVPLHEFGPFFSGIVVRAGKSLHAIAREHVPTTPTDHWFWGQFRAFRKPIGEIALGSLVANMLAVGVALFSLQVYDRVIPHQSQATLWVLAFGAFLAIAMEGILKLARSRLMDNAGRQIEMKVQAMLLDRILGMRSDGRPASPSGLFASMREFSSVREFFTASTIGTITDVPFIFLFLFLVASIAGNLMWVLVAGGILMVLPGYFFQKRMMALTQATQGASAKASRILHEAIYELDTVKTTRGEDRIRRIWDELNLLSSSKSSEQRKLAAILTFWSQGVQQLTYIAAVVIGTYLVFAGEFTVGTIIATGILTSRTLAPLSSLAGTMARWSNVKTALQGLDAIVQSPQEQAQGRSYIRKEALQGAFELRGVEFHYDADSAATVEVAGISIKAGQKIAVLGSNGSGKSTLLKLLAGLYAPQKGRILLDGVDIAQIDPRDLRRQIGYLGQDVRLFAGSLRENLNLTGLERDEHRMLDALDFAGLGPFVRSHPKGLDLEIRDGGEGLSIGQRQSIGWARLWMQDPVICLLDEPTAALDQTLETTLVSRLETWLAQRSAVIATHRLPILKLTERTVILQNGRLIVDGPRDEVVAHLTRQSGDRA